MHRPHDTPARPVPAARRAPAPGLGALLLAGALIAAPGVLGAQLTSPASSDGPPASPPGATVFLVGDAGVVSPERTILLEHLGRTADSLTGAAPDRSVAAVFLGDNVYEEGIRPLHADVDREILVEQVTLAGLGHVVPVYFVAGNHDWADGGEEREGLRRLRLQARAVDSIAQLHHRRAALLPEPGCPGPDVVDLGPDLRMVLIDTEWMIRRAATCPDRTRTEFLTRLASSLAAASDRPVLVLAHHPLETGGPHGGGGSWLDQIWKWIHTSRQDLKSGRYDDMVEDLLAAVDSAGHRRVAVASGHEHSLQVIDVEEDGVAFTQIVSGSAAKLTDVDEIDGTRLAVKRRGYVRLDVDGETATLTAFGLDPDSGSMEMVWQGPLFAPAPEN